MHSYQCEYLLAGVLTTSEVLTIHLLGEVCYSAIRLCAWSFLVPLSDLLLTLPLVVYSLIPCVYIPTDLPVSQMWPGSLPATCI